MTMAISGIRLNVRQCMWRWSVCVSSYFYVQYVSF